MVKERSEPAFSRKMKRHAARNYLKTHRKQLGLSQLELGQLLGYKDQGQVSRHERSQSTPSLEAALAYEVIFRVPISAIFADLSGTVKLTIEEKLAALEADLMNRDARSCGANVVAQKLVWLNDRKER